MWVTRDRLSAGQTPPKAANDPSGLKRVEEDLFLFCDTQGEEKHTGPLSPFFLLRCCHGNVVISANRGRVSEGAGHVLIGAMRGRVALLSETVKQRQKSK